MRCPFTNRACGEVSDATLRDVCDAEQRVPITLDLDFSDLRTYRDTPGCILLRLHRQDRDHVLKVLAQILPLLDPPSIPREKVGQ